MDTFKADEKEFLKNEQINENKIEEERVKQEEDSEKETKAALRLE